ncbi:MAG: hypothetical protein L0271_11115 [Gemmatimonadetes bacterium]|nr:hypothetical protein [Gemmatimonadota bacterium]
MNTLGMVQEGLSFNEIVRNIPHDAAAIVAYLLVAGFVYLIWRGNRKRRS